MSCRWHAQIEKCRSVCQSFFFFLSTQSERAWAWVIRSFSPSLRAQNKCVCGTSVCMHSQQTCKWNDSAILSKSQTKRHNNSFKYLLRASTTITSKKKKWNPWENCQMYAPKLLWNVCILLVLGDLIFYGQWIMDQRLWQTLKSIDFLHSPYKRIQTTLSSGKHCKTVQIGLFQDSDSAGDLEESKSTSGGTLCMFGKHTCVPKKLDVQ